MRLYPPAPVITREVEEPFTLGGVALKQGMVLYVPIQAVHRHERLWDRPEQFDPTRFLGDAGRATMLIETLPAGRSGPIDANAWWVEARIVSRGLMDQGDAKTAYRLATLKLAKTADDIAEAEFHAGWYALRGLNDPAAAETHFKNLISASPKAHDQARGYYWLGRAAEAGGPGAAKEFYARSSDYPATFY
eukprot:gene58177-79677_t